MRIAQLMLLAGIATIVVVLARAEAEGSAATEADRLAAVRSAIDSSNAYWIAAYERHDSDAIMDVYADNPVSLGDSGRVTRGRSDIQANSARFMERYNPVKLYVDTDEVWLVDETTAYESGEYGIWFVPEGADTSFFAQKFIAVWALQSDGKWRTTLTMGVPKTDRDTPDVAAPESN